MRRLIAWILVIGLLGAGGWYWRMRSQAAAAQKNQVTYREENVRRGNLSVTISGSGPVTSVNGVMVRSNQSGTVRQVLAQDGDTVKAGQTVVILQNDNLEAQLKQTQVDLQNNLASLENLLNPQQTAIRAQELKLESARLTLTQRQTDMENLTIRAPQAGVISSVKVTQGTSVTANTLLYSIYDDVHPTFTVMLPQQAAMAMKPGLLAKVDVTGFGTFTGTVMQSASSATPTSGNRDANVPVDLALPRAIGIRPGMVGLATFDLPGFLYVVQGNGAVKSEVVEVRAQVSGTAGPLPLREGDRVAPGDVLVELTNESLLMQLRQAENEVAVQEQALNNLLHPDQDPSGQLRILRSRVEQSEITLATRQADYDDLRVKAPVDGQISALTARVGDRITPGTALFRVADYGMMQVSISVDELDIAKAKVGQRAAVTLDAIPGRPYAGRVTKINPEGTFRNDIATFEVTVTIDRPQGLLAGMNATVNIVVEERQNVLSIPTQAVRVAQGRASVQVLENGEPVTREIQVGLRAGTRTEVTAGLNEGDKVITTIIRPTASPLQGIPGLGGGGGFPGGGGPGGNVPAGTGGNRVPNAPGR